MTTERSGPPGAVTGLERAVVIGGASGIGAAIAGRLARRMAVTVADIDAAGAAEVAGQLGAEPQTLDVLDPAAVARFFADRPAPAVLVCSVGGARRSSLSDVDNDLWLRTLDLNTGGFFRCAKEAVAAARRDGTRLSIVHIGSSLAGGPAPQLAHFAAAKAACASLVRSMAAEWAPEGVRVNSVVPGLVRTPATEAILAADTGLAASTPLGRVGHPEDIAGAVDYLTGPDSEWITGTALVIDGGTAVSG